MFERSLFQINQALLSISKLNLDHILPPIHIALHLLDRHRVIAELLT